MGWNKSINMKKIISLILVISFLFNGLDALALTTSLPTSLTRLIGGNNYDEAQAVTTAPDGSVYVAGYTQSTYFNTEINGGNYDGFLVKYIVSNTPTPTPTQTNTPTENNTPRSNESILDRYPVIENQLISPIAGKGHVLILLKKSSLARLKESDLAGLKGVKLNASNNQRLKVNGVDLIKLDENTFISKVPVNDTYVLSFGDILVSMIAVKKSLGLISKHPFPKLAPVLKKRNGLITLRTNNPNHKLPKDTSIEVIYANGMTSVVLPERLNFSKKHTSVSFINPLNPLPIMALQITSTHGSMVKTSRNTRLLTNLNK